MNKYDSDILAWSDHPVALLRRLAAAKRVNDKVAWETGVEQTESVVNEQLHAATSLSMHTLGQIPKAEAWPLSWEVVPVVQSAMAA